MDVATLAGVYTTSRTILRLLHRRPLADTLIKMATAPPGGHLTELSIALTALEQHLRVMGLEQVLVPAELKP